MAAYGATGIRIHPDCYQSARSKGLGSVLMSSTITSLRVSPSGCSLHPDDGNGHTYFDFSIL